MKIIIVLLDGAGDRSCQIFGNRTPLQAADTPNLNRLAALGGSGLFHASRIGQCLPSETAHYLLFGYDLGDFPGRGLLEAVGYGTPFNDGDVLSLAHLSGVDFRGQTPLLTVARKRIEENEVEISSLYAAVKPVQLHGIDFHLHRTDHNDAILVMSGDVSPYVSDSDPMIPGYPMARIKPLFGNPEPEKAVKTARALNAYLSYCHGVLSERQLRLGKDAVSGRRANFLATQRCGRRIVQRPFEELWGLRGMLIASGAIYGGLAHELGLMFNRQEDSSDPGLDLRKRIRIALADSAHEFFHVHTKVPDEAAHKGDPFLKKTVLSKLDRGLDELVNAVKTRDDLIVAVTADHSTPCESTLIHSGEPVPVTVVGGRARRDSVEIFDEIEASKGCVGSLRGRELMLLLLNYADQSVLAGHRLGSRQKTHFPGRYEAFTGNGSI